MAFPSVAGTAGKVAYATNTATHTPPYPTVSGGIQAGDLLIAVGCIDTGTNSISNWGGWTELKQLAVQATSAMTCYAYKIASGGESGNISPGFTLATTEHGSWIVICVQGWHGTTPPEISTGAVGNSAAADPDALTPSWGTADTLWIAAGGLDFGVTASAAPTNYTGLETQTNDTSGGGTFLAYRQLNASSENPGAFTNSTEQWAAVTIGVRPTAGSTQNQAITATATGTASLIRQGRIIRSATATGAASLIRSARKTLTVTATGTPTISRLQSLKLTLTATATGTATLVRRALTTLTATATGTATMTRQATVRITATGTGSASYGPVVVKKTLQAAGTGSPAVVKFTSRTLAAAATGTPSFQFTRVVMMVLTANATGTASLRRGAAHSIQAAAAGTASFKRDATHTIQTAALGTASFARRAAHTIQAAAAGTAQFSTAGVIKVVLTATATGTASIVKRAALTLLAGGTGTASQTPVNAGTTATQQSITANATGTPSLGLLFIPNVGVRKWLMNLRTWARPPQTRRDDL